jgi:poly [ADP-ribose] polymerase
MSATKEKMLIKVSAAANNNKFYHVILNDNDTVTKRWGRVGTDGTSTTEQGGSTLFEYIVNQKINRGYKPTSILSVEDTAVENLKDVAHKVLRSDNTKADPVLESLIDRLVAANRHDIMQASGGMIKVNTSGVITTPLGLVNLESLEQASKILKIIRRAKNDQKVNLIEEYLTLVPQKVPSQRGWEESFLSSKEEIQKQKDFVSQLADSIKWHEAEVETQKKAASGEIDLAEKYKDLFAFKLSILDSKGSEFKRINKMFESSKNRHHSHTARSLKLKRVFQLNSDVIEAKYSEALRNVGNEKTLWHGTQAFNVLSILRQGLIVPPLRGTSYVTTGRMFGDGVYFSDQSTKSLGYANGGYWNNGVADGNCFMFLSDVAMGREFKPSYFNNESLNKAHYGHDRFGKKFNSINVKGGTCNVMNNEMIVWDTDQIKLKYLCEFGK